MRWTDSGFKATEGLITGVMHDSPGTASGKHGHMEAGLYCLEGEGYSIVDEERLDWKKGTFVHVPGPQTVHQHFNTGKIEARHLRINYGLRSKLFQPLAKRVFPYLYYEFSEYGK
jgi:gentisate 1,2-dioxygenase